MDNDQAKFILRAYRSSGKDDESTEMAMALERARQDPELGRWLAEESAFDRAMLEKLREIKPPADLKEQILAGRAVIRPVGFDWKPVWVALAASLAVLFAIVFLSPVTKPDQAVAAEAFAVDYLEKLTRLDHKASTLPELQSWLKSKSKSIGTGAQNGLAGVQTIGCRLADWEGREFSLICFKPGVEGLRPEVHLFVFKREDLPGLPERSEVHLAQRGDWAVAGWADGDSSYIMARVGDSGSLRKLL